MDIQYRIIIRAVKPGRDAAAVLESVIGLLKGDPAVLRERLKLDGSFSMRAPDADSARQWRARLEAMGCECVIDPDPDAGAPVAAPVDFSKLPLRAFVSTGFGLVFEAPGSWRETSNDSLFQVTDPSSNAMYTASAVEGENITLDGWAEFRFGVVASKMPYLRPLRAAQAMQGRNWSGLCAEYRGVFPGNAAESHYLVLCLCANGRGISFTLTVDAQVFDAHEDFFRRLITQHLSLAAVHKLGEADAPPGTPPISALRPKPRSVFPWVLVGISSLIAILGVAMLMQQLNRAPEPVATQLEAPAEAEAEAPDQPARSGPELTQACWIVGEYEVTNRGQVLAHTTLAADGTYRAEAKYAGGEGKVFSGRWGLGWHVDRHAIWWFHEFPEKSEEINDLVGAPENGFDLVERDKEITQWRRIRRIASEACAQE